MQMSRNFRRLWVKPSAVYTTRSGASLRQSGGTFRFIVYGSTIKLCLEKTANEIFENVCDSTPLPVQHMRGTPGLKIQDLMDLPECASTLYRARVCLYCCVWPFFTMENQTRAASSLQSQEHQGSSNYRNLLS